MNIERYWIALSGKITACATHDLNNVLATIRESAGLISDCIAAGGSFDGKGGQMAGSSLKVIESQVGSGITLVNAVNRFAHISDTDQGRTGNLYDVAGHAVFLMNGVAKRQGLALSLGGSEDKAEVSGDQFLIRVIVFLVIDSVMACCGEGDSIEVSVGRREGRSILFVDRRGGHAAVSDDFDKWNVVKEALESIGGHVEKDSADSGVGVFF